MFRTGRVSWLHRSSHGECGQIAAYCQIVVSSNSNLGEAVVLIWNDCNMPFWSCLLLNDTLGAAFRLIPWLHAWCLDDRLFLQCRYRRRNKSGPGQRGMLTHAIRGLRMSRLPSKLRALHRHRPDDHQRGQRRDGDRRLVPRGL